MEMDEVLKSNQEADESVEEYESSTTFPRTRSVINSYNADTNGSESTEGTESSEFWWIRLSYSWRYKVSWISETVQNNVKYKTPPFNKPQYADCRLDIRLPKRNKKWKIITDKHWNIVYTKKGALWRIVYWNAKVEWKSKPQPHIETYYSEKKLSWTWLNIPWRHVANDGTIRDKDGYICVASRDPKYFKGREIDKYPMGSRVMTTLWPWKVYDRWAMWPDIIDIYTSW